VGRVMVAAGASVHSNFLPLSIRKLIEHAVVQLNECIQQSAGGIELECQAPFRKVDLHAHGVGFQTLTNVPRCILNKVFQERLARIPVQYTLRIEQAQRRCRNHSLFHRPVSVSLSGLKVGHSIDAIAEGASRQSRQLPGVTVRKRNGDAIRGEILQAHKWVSSKTRLGLLTVRYDGRSGSFQAADLVVIARDETIAKSVNNETLHHMSCSALRSANVVDR